MNYEQKRGLRRRVRSSMLPCPKWNSYDALPTCVASCVLFVNGACAWNKAVVVAGNPCVPVLTMCVDILGKRGG